MSETIDTIIQWHKDTFPNADIESQKTKFDEEMAEYNADVNMLELADMFIAACGIARFDSIAALEYFAVVFKAMASWKVIGARGVLQETVNIKMEKNRKRVWAKQENGSYHHTNKED